MFELFAEGTEDLYTTVLEPYIRKTPALAGCVCNEMMTKPHCHLQSIQRRMTYILAFSATSDFHEVVPMGFLQKDLKRLMRALVQDHCIFLIVNYLTD